MSLHILRRALVSCVTSVRCCSYDAIHRRSLTDPEGFWNEVAQGIDWYVPYTKVLDNSQPAFARWFVGGQLNTCYNAVDRHVSAGRGQRVALIHDSPVTNTVRSMTYLELQDQVSRLSGFMSSLGVEKGDFVLIYMPMVPEAVVAMLATVRLGAVHSLVFGGFAPRELATRIAHCQPKVIISASCGVEPSRIVSYKPMLEEALGLAKFQPKGCVVLQRESFEKATLRSGLDYDWIDALEKARPHGPVSVDSNDPCYVLYTSGTTGMPKGIVRPTGGHAVILPWTMKAIYNMTPDDTWWAASDLGWVVGHSYICYAPLFHGNTSIIYEGKPVGTPDTKQFFRVVRDHGVRGMFTSPTALRAISRSDPNAKAYGESRIKYLFIAGEPLDHETRDWAEQAFKVPALDNWWQTETGYAISAHAVGLGMPVNPPKGTTGKPFVGFDIKVLDEIGNEASHGELGRIVCKLPLPPGCMTTLYRAEDVYTKLYFELFPGYYDTMDAGVLYPEGYLSVESREDDVINVAGHRLSTLCLEEAVMEHPDVADAAVIGVPDKLKGEVPLALYILRKDAVIPKEALQKELVTLVRDIVGPVAAFRLSANVPGLPRTRSGKTSRKSIADMAKGKNIAISPAIENPSIYTHIHSALQSLGFANDIEDPYLCSVNNTRPI